MTGPVIYGARYSVYVRSVLLALREKRVTHDLVEVDVFDPAGVPREHLRRHPFGKIPAFAHGTLRLYETPAIIRYIDEAFDGRSLQPADVGERARMMQAIGILDSYAYRAWVWDIYVERVSRPKRGEVSDETKIARGCATGMTAARALEDILGDKAWLAGTDLSLADLHAAPMLAYLRKAPEGEALIGACPRLADWANRLAERPSVTEICT